MFPSSLTAKRKGGSDMTDREVQRKLDKLCARYRETSASLVLMQPSKRPTRRKQSRLEFQAGGLLETLREAREPHAAALVKLAYVRGMRSVVSDMKLGATEQAEVSLFQSKLNHELSKVEMGQLLDFRDRFRRLMLAHTLEKRNVSDIMVDAVRTFGDHYPLEQRARASVQVAVDLAHEAGAVAAKRSGNYDTRDAA